LSFYLLEKEKGTEETLALHILIWIEMSIDIVRN